jgi:hypothetical protein
MTIINGFAMVVVYTSHPDVSTFRHLDECILTKRIVFIILDNVPLFDLKSIFGKEVDKIQSIGKCFPITKAVFMKNTEAHAGLTRQEEMEHKSAVVLTKAGSRSLALSFTRCFLSLVC